MAAVNQAMSLLLRLDGDKLVANQAELTAAVHVLQSFVIQHALSRHDPMTFSRWYAAMAEPEPEVIEGVEYQLPDFLTVWLGSDAAVAALADGLCVSDNIEGLDTLGDLIYRGEWEDAAAALRDALLVQREGQK